MSLGLILVVILLVVAAIVVFRKKSDKKFKVLKGTWIDETSGRPSVLQIDEEGIITPFSWSADYSNGNLSVQKASSNQFLEITELKEDGFRGKSLRGDEIVTGFMAVLNPQKTSFNLQGTTYNKVSDGLLPEAAIKERVRKLLKL